MKTKNFALRLKQGQPWELAPAYDLIHPHNPKFAKEAGLNAKIADAIAAEFEVIWGKLKDLLCVSIIANLQT